MGHFLYSHWLVYPLFCVGLFSHLRVSSQSIIHTLNGLLAPIAPQYMSVSISY